MQSLLVSWKSISSLGLCSILICSMIVNPQRVTLYQVGDIYEGASFNNFLDAIDGSYCTSGGGDNPLM
jgi:hypothetical protein